MHRSVNWGITDIVILYVGKETGLRWEEGGERLNRVVKYHATTRE